MKNILFISILGALGVISRHLLENRLGHKSDFLPLGTLTANVIGCFLAGLLYQYIASRTNHQELASMALVGFCGGLTTFSGYALSSLNDIIDGEYSKAVVYLLISPLLGMLCALAGIKLFKAISLAS